jgi:hypothetical protein
MATETQSCGATSAEPHASDIDDRRRSYTHVQFCSFSPNDNVFAKENWLTTQPHSSVLWELFIAGQNPEAGD